MRYLAILLAVLLSGCVSVNPGPCRGLTVIPIISVAKAPCRPALAALIRWTSK